ncbi:hypothetical protein G7Y79_00010g028270 [Physcia stellaris]|nr:hypothetical protein G7Y79_00010g028270 [Physcia stellaris]
MSNTNSKDHSDIKDLRATVASTSALIATFQASLSSATTSTSSPSEIASPPNPLRLLSDACALLKAQTTKLSLLILNKPFTPTAITFILKNLSTECLPALMSAVELCSPKQYTTFLRDHISANVSRIMREMTSFLACIPVEEQNMAASASVDQESEGRNTLPSTGVVWEICDALIALSLQGLVDVAMKKADAYHALIKDAITELEEWNPDEDEGDIFDSGASTDSNDNRSSEPPRNAESPPTVALNAMTLTPPATPTPIRQISTQTPHTDLPTCEFIYLPAQLPTSWQVYAFDNLMQHLRVFSEMADDLAGALYGGDEEQASGGLEMLKMQAFECLEELDRNWDQNRKADVFTEWSQKWMRRLEELGPSHG